MGRVVSIRATGRNRTSRSPRRMVSQRPRGDPGPTRRPRRSPADPGRGVLQQAARRQVSIPPMVDVCRIELLDHQTIDLARNRALTPHRTPSLRSVGPGESDSARGRCDTHCSVLPFLRYPPPVSTDGCTVSWSLLADVTRRSPRRGCGVSRRHPHQRARPTGGRSPAGTSAHETQAPEQPADGAPSSAVDGALRRAADPAVRARAPVLVGLGRMPTHARQRGRGGAGRCCARIRHQPTGIVRNGHRGDVRQRWDAGGRRQHERPRGRVLTALRPCVRESAPPRYLVAHSGPYLSHLQWLVEPRFQTKRRQEGKAIPRTGERRSCCGDRAGCADAARSE